MQRASGTYYIDQNEYIFVRKRNGRYHIEETVGPKLLKMILQKSCGYSWTEVTPVAARSKVWVFGPSLAMIVRLNLTRHMDVCFL
jgi:hypothetical protein